MNYVKQFKEASKNKGCFIVFDTETTGLNPEDNDIIEFSAIKFVVGESTAKKADEIDIFIDPGYPIPEEATKLTGITDEDVKGQYTAETAYKTIKDFFGDNPVVAGYNVSFDITFIDALYSKFEKNFVCESLDILKMAREKLPKPISLLTHASTWD